ncbi:hypothetical protein [Streptomyces sp. NBC_01198]|uniref:hypothetical protein n=1 Tax=Streptomyces sp. NBC_01198 TaxID=2903769 RepID=UPI002E12816F|nr:hypothetical protein OG702_10300 [Streptomyces sp. NBC_01198]
MIVSAVMLLGRAAGLPAARRAKRLAAGAADRGFPGRLAVISARPCFPASGGAEILFRVRDDPDAVVRLRVDRAAPSQARLAEAVEEGLAAARRWRALAAALHAGGHQVHALGRIVADPWIAAAPTNDTVADLLAGLRDCLAAGPEAPPTAVMVADPVVVRSLPRERDPSLPTLLRLNANRRLAALSGRRPYYRASFDAAGAPELSLVHPFTDWPRYEAAVTASAAGWLARTGSGAGVAAVMSHTRLVPGRVDRLRVHVVLHDGPRQGRAALGDHVLTATTDLDGAFAGEPTVLRDVRDGTGPLRLPPL